MKFLAVSSCLFLVANAQLMTMTLDERVPDMLQMYDLLDERAESIANAARDLGAAIDALKSGRSREFLKAVLASSPLVEGTPDAASLAIDSAEPASTAMNSSRPASVRAKRSYGSSYGRSYGGYSNNRGYNSNNMYGSGSRYGGYNSYPRYSGYSGSNYGSRYGGYGSMNYGGYGSNGRYYG